MIDSKDINYIIIRSQLEDIIHTVDPDTDDGKRELDKMARTYADEIKHKDDDTFKGDVGLAILILGFVLGAIIF